MFSGCGRESTTVTLEFTAHGTLPAGVQAAPFTLEEIHLFVNEPDHENKSFLLLDDEEGARTYDLARLQTSAPSLVAERDVPEGEFQHLSISFDTDEAPEPGVLPLAPNAPTRIDFDLPANNASGGTIHLLVDFDISASVLPVDGGAVFFPTAQVEVQP
jgi:hypothetical protein